MVGFSAGLTWRRSPLTADAMIVVLGAVITLVIDLDRPHGDFILSQEPLLQLQQQVGPPRRRLPSSSGHTRSRCDLLGRVVEVQRDPHSHTAWVNAPVVDWYLLTSSVFTSGRPTDGDEAADARQAEGFALSATLRHIHDLFFHEARSASLAIVEEAAASRGLIPVASALATGRFRAHRAPWPIIHGRSCC